MRTENFLRETPAALRSVSTQPYRRRAPHRIRRHRTIFISDTHLGARGCRAELLAGFLAHNDCDTLYLAGDIVDGWRLRRSWFWNEAHSHVLNEILHKVDEGIHHAQMKTIRGVLYCNDGDWVESCTALTEDAWGRLEIVTWTAFAQELEVLPAPGRTAPAPATA